MTRIRFTILGLWIFLGVTIGNAWHLEPTLIDSSFGDFRRIKTYAGKVMTTNSRDVFSSDDGIVWKKSPTTCAYSADYNISSISPDGNGRTGYVGVGSLAGRIGMVFNDSSCTEEHMRFNYSIPGLVDIIRVPGISPYYLMVGNKGTILHCVDPHMTVPCTTTVTSDFYSIAATATEAVAVGYKGGIAYARYPFTRWKTIPVDTSLNFFGVKHLGGRFIAVGDKGAVLHITNDTNWTLSSVGMDIWLADVAKGEMGYVAVSYGHAPIDGQLTLKSFVFQSFDAASWSIIDTVPSQLCSIEFINSGKILITGGGGVNGRNGGIIYRSSETTPIKSRAIPHDAIVSIKGTTNEPYRLNGKILRNSTSNNASGISVHTRRATVGISHNRRSQ